MRFKYEESFLKASLQEVEEFEDAFRKGFLDCLQEEEDWKKLFMDLPSEA